MQGWGWLHYRFSESISWTHVGSWLADPPRASECSEAQVAVSDQSRGWHTSLKVSDGNLIKAPIQNQDSLEEGPSMLGVCLDVSN